MFDYIRLKPEGIKKINKKLVVGCACALLLVTVLLFGLESERTRKPATAQTKKESPAVVPERVNVESFNTLPQNSRLSRVSRQKRTPRLPRKTSREPNYRNGPQTSRPLPSRRRRKSGGSWRMKRTSTPKSSSLKQARSATRHSTARTAGSGLHGQHGQGRRSRQGALAVPGMAGQQGPRLVPADSSPVTLDELAMDHPSKAEVPGRRRHARTCAFSVTNMGHSNFDPVQSATVDATGVLTIQAAGMCHGYSEWSCTGHGQEWRIRCDDTLDHREPGAARTHVLADARRRSLYGLPGSQLANSTVAVDLWQYFYDAEDGPYLNYSVSVQGDDIFAASPTVNGNGYLLYSLKGDYGLSGIPLVVTVVGTDRAGESTERIVYGAGEQPAIIRHGHWADQWPPR